MAAEGGVNLYFIEAVAHHCNENVDKDNDDWDEVCSEHNESNLLHVERAVIFCPQ